jgi:DNA-binding MarR family transcriptional regulator
MSIKHQMKAVNTVVNRINELYSKWAKSHGLNYHSLMVLYAMNDKESCTQKKISEEWLIPKQTIHTILKDFLHKGFVVFETDPKDKREKMIRFTKEGKAYAQTILVPLYEMEEKVVQKMGKEMAHMLFESNRLFCELLELEVENE